MIKIHWDNGQKNDIISATDDVKIPISCGWQENNVIQSWIIFN